MVFPASSSEGWPKVLSEGMAYGIVPVAGDVSSIPQYLKTFRTGKTFAPDDTAGFVGAIIQYHENPRLWKEESERGVKEAGLFSYENYLMSVRRMIKSTSQNAIKIALRDDLSSQDRSSSA